MSLKIILIIIVVFEIYFGSFFIFRYYRDQIEQKRVIEELSLINIDKSSIVPSTNKNLKYYWELTPNQFEEDQPSWLPYKATYSINSDGLNDLNDYSIEKPKDTYRIIALGDSFTYGHYVNTKDNWTEQLEVMFNSGDLICEYKNFEVINLGMPGFDVQYIVQRYKELGQKYNPDLILWFDSSSGFYRYNELARPILDKCLSESSNLDPIEQGNDYYPCATKAEKQVKQQYSPQELNEMIQRDFDIFFNLSDIGNSIIFYYDSLNGEQDLLVSEWNKRYSEAIFIPLIPEDMKENRLPDGHPNIKGHKTIAENIFRYLKNEKIICPI